MPGQPSVHVKMTEKMGVVDLGKAKVNAWSQVLQMECCETNQPSTF